MYSTVQYTVDIVEGNRKPMASQGLKRGHSVHTTVSVKDKGFIFNFIEMAQ